MIRANTYNSNMRTSHMSIHIVVYRCRSPRKSHITHVLALPEVSTIQVSPTSTKKPDTNSTTVPKITPGTHSMEMHIFVI